MLPPLPQQNRKKEADFGITFRSWLKSNPMTSCSFELKHTRGKNNFPFNELKSEQIVYAINIVKGSLIRVQGLQGEPDYVYLKNVPAYIVIKYPLFFCLITIEEFLKEKRLSSRKSLTDIRAKEISTVCV